MFRRYLAFTIGMALVLSVGCSSSTTGGTNAIDQTMPVIDAKRIETDLMKNAKLFATENITGARSQYYATDGLYDGSSGNDKVYAGDVTLQMPIKMKDITIISENKAVKGDVQTDTFEVSVLVADQQWTPKTPANVLVAYSKGASAKDWTCSIELRTVVSVDENGESHYPPNVAPAIYSPVTPFKTAMVPQLIQSYLVNGTKKIPYNKGNKVLETEATIKNVEAGAFAKITDSVYTGPATITLSDGKKLQADFVVFYNTMGNPSKWQANYDVDSSGLELVDGKESAQNDGGISTETTGITYADRVAFESILAKFAAAVERGDYKAANQYLDPDTAQHESEVMNNKTSVADDYDVAVQEKRPMKVTYEAYTLANHYTPPIHKHLAKDTPTLNFIITFASIQKDGKTADSSFYTKGVKINGKWYIGGLATGL